ncbi:MAG: NADH:ubiquinone reductase (Na(+)-transporting) subunit B, partial [Brachymonas sp.]|nr:NADH:ubiquinone reductase (Na(+)-transporting) subunit B [Brachymonas sp.]
MRPLRALLDRLEPHFLPGGKWHRLYAVYEAVDTIFYTPKTVTYSGAHVRDGIDLKRVMITVMLSTFPAMFWGMFNVGRQANIAMAHMGIAAAPGWRGALVSGLAGYNPQSVWDCFWHGAVWFVPIYAVAFVVGSFWEILFASVRRHEVNEGFFVTSVLFALILPPTIALWQVALGISFAVVLGKEVFGGTGKNFINPALAGRAFLFFSYPAAMTGDTVWTAVDGFSGATALGQAAAAPVGQLTQPWGQPLTWMDAFLGHMQGSIGEVSTLAILLGSILLLWTGIASWRIMLAVFLGMAATSLLFNLLGSADNPLMQMPLWWHFVLGGFAFG